MTDIWSWDEKDGDEDILPGIQQVWHHLPQHHLQLSADRCPDQAEICWKNPGCLIRQLPYKAGVCHCKADVMAVFHCRADVMIVILLQALVRCDKANQV